MAGQLSTDDGDLGFQVAPMVDVIFVLLLFFMANVGLQMIERQTGTSLPHASNGQQSAAASDPVIIQIGEDGSLAVGDEKLFLAERPRQQLLSNWLQQKLAATQPPPVVILSPDSRTRHSRIIEVMAACGEAGVENLSFQ